MPGSGSQVVEARIWQPGFFSQDLESWDVVARIWKPRSGSEDDVKAFVFI